MNAPVRLQLSRRKGFDLQALSQATNGLAAVSVARPGPWGNPYVVSKHGTQEECVYLFRMMVAGYHALNMAPDLAEQKASGKFIAEHITDLRGKNLACWCRQGTPCHADVLLELANQTREGR